VEAFLVLSGEEITKLDVCFVGGGFEAPHVAGESEHAGGLEQDGGELNESSVGDGVTAGSSNALDFMESIPKGFNGVGRRPEHGDAGTIALQVVARDGAVGCA